MLNYEYPPIGGGGGYAGRNILRQFAGRSDISLDVVVSRMEHDNSVEEFADNITLYRVGVDKKALHFWTRIEVLRWMRRAFRVHKELLAKKSYDLAHAFFGFPTGALTWRTGSRLPYIISLRGSDVPGVNARFALDYKVLGPIFRRTWRNASGLYANSNGLKERALAFMPDAEIGVIANGVELDRFTPLEHECSGDNLRLLTVGRLSVSKRIEMLIESVAILRKIFPNTTLTIAGGGGLAGKLAGLIKDSGLENCVKLSGVVPADRMPELYREHDIFVTATAQEGMSNAMLEAMSSGLPIVTTECEGVAELITDNGIVVKQPEARLIAEAVRLLANEPRRYRQMCIAARNRAEQFGWDGVAGQYLDCYRRVIEMTKGERADG